MLRKEEETDTIPSACQDLENPSRHAVVSTVHREQSALDAGNIRPQKGNRFVFDVKDALPATEPSWIAVRTFLEQNEVEQGEAPKHLEFTSLYLSSVRCTLLRPPPLPRLSLSNSCQRRRPQRGPQGSEEARPRGPIRGRTIGRDEAAVRSDVFYRLGSVA